MSLSPAERARYARHILLPELGLPGQERLCAAKLTLRACGDDEALHVAGDYLQRAGITLAEVADDAIDVSSLPSRGVLRHAAAAFAGAFVAVEAIKRITHAGTPAGLPIESGLFVEES